MGNSLKVLVTGGAGFIGSHIVESWLSEDHSVRVLDNLESGSLENLDEFRKEASFRFIEGDIRKEKDVVEAVEGVDAVFHEAAVTSVPVSVKNPDMTRDVNVGGTVNLLVKCEEFGVDKFVFASSCAVYGEAENLPIDEETQLEPNSPYARSKLLGEEHVLERESLDSVVLRYFNVYGPRQSGGRYAGVIVKFIDRLREGVSPIIYGDGEQTRDFIYVKDIVRANLLALRREEANGEVFNVGGGVEISINELCRKLLKIMNNSEIEPEYEPPREGDIKHSKADITKISEKLGYSLEVSLEEGLRELLDEDN